MLCLPVSAPVDRVYWFASAEWCRGHFDQHCNMQDAQRADIPLPETKGTQNKDYVKEHCMSVQQYDYN